MIRIDRERPIKPSDAWFQKAEKETRKAIDEREAHEVSELYRHHEVKMALEALFHDKCAYCESQLGTAGPWDVEHYRPKGRVAERPDHPGYYWLTYRWTNLYPACTFCNQRRRDPPRRDDPTWRPAMGKLDQFPLADEADRAMSHDDDLVRERPLLLDPCSPEEDPEEYFIYDLQGQIHPRRLDDERASTTIRICHLTRRRLRDDRARILVRVVKLLGTLSLAREKGHDEVTRSLEELLEEFVADEALHAGAARAAVHDPTAFGLGA